MLTVSMPSTSMSPPYTYDYYVVVTDSGNGAKTQSRTATLTAHRPAGVDTPEWVWEPDITTVSVKLTSWDSAPVAYRYTLDALTSLRWTPWTYSTQTVVQPIIADYWDGTGNIMVQAKTRDSYGCESTPVKESTWISF
jgi:hypothetical protein